MGNLTKIHFINFHLLVLIFYSSILFANHSIALSNTNKNDSLLLEIAQKHHRDKQYQLAIESYKQLAKSDQKETIWISKYLLAICYEEMGFWDQSLQSYLEAYSINPNRAEPLCKIATHYRSEGKNYLAHLCLKQGVLIPKPAHDTPYIEPSVYDYGLDTELSIVSYYTDAPQNGFAACNRLILKKNIPQDIKKSAFCNLLFYIESLKMTKFLEIEIDLPPIRETSSTTYRPMNTSILKIPDGYLLFCRTVNYTKQDARFKWLDSQDPNSRSRNFLLEYDRNLKLRTQKEILESYTRDHKQCIRMYGLEDCRVFFSDQKIWLTCATFGTHSNIIGQTLCQLNPQASSKHVEVEQFIPLKSPIPTRVEKNWLPFMKEGRLHLIYSFDPLIIYEADFQNGTLSTILRADQPYDFSTFRGSAGPIDFDEGYLVLVHEMFFEQNHYYYFSRFLYLDKNFKILKISKPFYIKNRGVEYCIGMTIDHEGTHCLIPVSIEDQEVVLCKIPLNHIRTLLEPLP